MAVSDSVLDTVNKRLLYWSKTQPDKPAFIFHNPHAATGKRLVFTRADVFTLASRYASILRRGGIKQGDVVCNTLPNSPERLLTDLGIMLAGAVAMNGMVVLSDGADFVSSIQRGGCVAVIMDPKQKWNQPLTVLESRLRSRAGHTIDFPDAPLLRTLLFVDSGVGQDGHRPFLELLQNENEAFVADVRSEDLAFIFATSGSTGFSKLVPRTHAEYLLLAESFHLVNHLERDDIYFNDEFFAWVGASPAEYVSSGVTCVCFVYTEVAFDGYDERLRLEILSRERCTAALFLPSFLERVLADGILDGLKFNLRLIETGSQPISKRHMLAALKMADMFVVDYGSTECGYLTMKVVNEDDKDDYEDGNSGLPLPGVEIKIVDDNQQEVVEPGETGDVLCRGPHVLTGYLGMELDAQDNIFTQDGWFRTGDVGFRNNKGELHVIGRKSNAITNGTFILYPGWLESRLARCPGVQSVIIVPVPDPIKYQELCACVMPQPGVSVTEKEVREFCKTLYLNPDAVESAVPRYYLFFDRFPTPCAVMGKPDRKAILASALQTLGMTPPAQHPAR